MEADVNETEKDTHEEGVSLDKGDAEQNSDALENNDALEISDAMENSDEAFLSAADFAWAARESAAAKEEGDNATASINDFAQPEHGNTVDDYETKDDSEKKIPAKRKVQDREQKKPDPSDSDDDDPSDSDDDDGVPISYHWIEPKLKILVQCGNNNIQFEAMALSKPIRKLPFLHGKFCKRGCYCRDWWVNVHWDTGKSEWVSCGRCSSMPEKGEMRKNQTMQDDPSDELAMFMKKKFKKLKHNFPQEFGSAINTVLKVVDILGGKLCTLTNIGIERIIREIITSSTSLSNEDRFKFGKSGNDCHFKIDGVTYDGKLDIRALEECLNRWLPNRDFIISRSIESNFHNELAKNTGDCVSVAQVVLNRVVLGNKPPIHNVIYPCIPSSEAQEDKYDCLFETSIVVSHSFNWPAQEVLVEEDSDGEVTITGTRDIRGELPYLYESTLRQKGMNYQLIPMPIDGYIETMVPFREKSNNALVKFFRHCWTISERTDGSKKVALIAEQKGKPHPTRVTVKTWVPGKSFLVRIYC